MRDEQNAMQRWKQLRQKSNDNIVPVYRSACSQHRDVIRGDLERLKTFTTEIFERLEALETARNQPLLPIARGESDSAKLREARRRLTEELPSEINAMELSIRAGSGTHVLLDRLTCVRNTLAEIADAMI